ncbi:hypothetical protein [Streptomyces sp. I05A-00742]|uniref:hypothetical protein n=1 Tax=Streptomyces sp. I05A-00742 TaxID=2732853 RepID=UPI001488FACF|nr:hypothetical protein [Streptomyces sp. I05A-00742]
MIQNALTQAVRLSAGLACAATVVAFGWALGIDHQPAPHTGVLVCVWTAAGAALLRAVLLWVRRIHGRRGPRRRAGRVSLEKDPLGDLGSRHLFDEVPYESDGWIKTRQLATHVLLLVAGMTAATFLALPGRDSQQAALQRAGAQVATATIAEPPRVVDTFYDDDVPDRVTGYSSRLRVTVPGGPARLPVGPIRTNERLRAGEHIKVLWSPSDPALGAYHGTSSELRQLADGGWRVDLLDGSAGVWAGIAVVFGLCMLPWVFTFALGVDTDLLSESAWSPVGQSLRALVFLAVAYGCTAALSGDPAHGFQALCLGGSWLLLPGMIFAPVYRMVKDG